VLVFTANGTRLCVFVTALESSVSKNTSQRRSSSEWPAASDLPTKDTYHASFCLPANRPVRLDLYSALQPFVQRPAESFACAIGVSNTGSSDRSGGEYTYDAGNLQYSVAQATSND